MSDPFVCPVCGKVSHHPADAAHGWCGQCHAFTGDESYMRELAEFVAGVACPDCGQQGTLRVVGRDALLAKPLGTFSLAGQQPKVSANKVRWPWVICSSAECSFEKKAKPAND